MNQDVAESLKQQQQRVGSGGDNAGSHSSQQLGLAPTTAKGVPVGQQQTATRTVAQLQAAAAASRQQLQQPVQQIVLQNVSLQPNTSTAQLLGKSIKNVYINIEQIIMVPPHLTMHSSLLPV